MQTVVQERPMGCAIACVAAVTTRSYTEAKALFEFPERDSTEGFSCSDIILALVRAGHHYHAAEYTTERSEVLTISGTIVFVELRERYGPFGHYLLRTQRGWMNPWINTPEITPARAGFETKLRGTVRWIIYPCAQS